MKGAGECGRRRWKNIALRVAERKRETDVKVRAEKVKRREENKWEFERKFIKVDLGCANCFYLFFVLIFCYLLVNFYCKKIVFVTKCDFYKKKHIFSET